ncbi:hypothetical protein BCR44DRAFT_390117 [Catenaria anguillulae PL171]|uniref:Uncharacterized protein n=1 Tax=Catenaria anguillulae PL171 TaxID=765915 RepID=A0A1Y2HS93_9FUNG|nr:hypothetical protein BCR44DRAFT_390117 [Catenaria anguillulae PL171]
MWTHERKTKTSWLHNHPITNNPSNQRDKVSSDPILVTVLRLFCSLAISALAIALLRMMAISVVVCVLPGPNARALLNVAILLWLP